MKKLLNELENLVNQGVINEAAAANISEYYKNKEEIQPNRLLIIFGILGACLIGLGLILIVAHNWDNLNRPVKTILAFFPLGLTQGLFGHTLWAKRESRAWREVSSILLFFSIAAAIALISQIYQIEGDERSFMLTWCILAMPIVFLMPSSVVSLFQLFIIGRLGVVSSIPGWHTTIDPIIKIDQLLLFAAIVTYYWHLIKTDPRSLFTLWHHWVIPFVFITLFFPNDMDFRIYGSLLLLVIYGILYSIGKTDYFRSESLLRNPFLVIGALGTIIIFFLTSFYGYWEHRIIPERGQAHELSYFIILSLLVLIISYLLSRQHISEKLRDFSPVQLSFVAFIIISIIGIINTYVALVLTNLWLLLIGLYYINLGLNRNHLIIMNLGVLVLSAMIIARFFEWNVSFVGRGIAFILVGCAFFLANYFLIKKSKA